MTKEQINKTLRESVTVEDIMGAYSVNRNGDPHILAQFVEQFGVEPIIFLSERVGGTMVYIPATHALVRRAHERELGNVSR